jgi:uncharacterized SAM-binding protein YcdF (DUF218 family)
MQGRRPTRVPPRLRRLSLTLSLVLAAGLVLVPSRALWLPWIGRFLVSTDPQQEADAIVPLAGERSRVFEAAALFGEGYAGWFVITEMWVADPAPPAAYSESVKRQATSRGVPAGRILVAPGTAASTFEEARNLRRVMEDQRWHSLIVVTSPFHTRRSRMILDDVFRGSGIRLTITTVRGHRYSAGRWWTSEEGRQQTALEYLKLALHLLGYHRIVDG